MIRNELYFFIFKPKQMKSFAFQGFTPEWQQKNETTGKQTRGHMFENNLEK